MTDETSFDVYCSQRDDKVATINLNGYEIESGGPLGQEGTLRSFRIVSGELWVEWDQQRILRMEGPNGETAQVRVAAMPVDEMSAGLLEFL